MDQCRTRPADDRDGGLGSSIRRRLARRAGVAGLLAAVAWAAATGLEVAQGHVSHSLVSRPERLFAANVAPLHVVLVGAAITAAALWLVLFDGLLLRSRTPEAGRAVVATARVLALAAAAAGVVVAAIPLSNTALDEVDPVRGWAAIALLIAAPAGVVLAGVAVRRRASALAWTSALVALAMVAIALDWTFWSAAAGGVQPQLWAVVPVQGLGAAWCAAAGLSLFSSASAPWSGVRLPAVPGPGRKASVAFAVVSVATVVATSRVFVAEYGPTIASQLSGRTAVETIHVDIDRTYRVYRPPSVAARPGLVIVLSGVFGSGFLMEHGSHFDAQADRLGWIAAYPDSVLDGWDAFGSGASWGLHPGADDVAFIGALIHHLEASDGVDPDRVYVTGLSRGAMMTYRLGCELSAEIAAIAPVSGNMATPTGSADVPCNLSRPVSVLAIHGTADAYIPFSGGTTDIPFSPFLDVIAKWQTWDGCAGAGTVAKDGASTTTSWQCRDAVTVAMRVVQGGWHSWPLPSGSASPANPDDFDAPRLIADFFVAHPRPSR